MYDVLLFVNYLSSLEGHLRAAGLFQGKSVFCILALQMF